MALIAGGGVGAMLDDLAREDAETFARIDRDNPMRVQRAWDVLRATGRGLTDWHRATAAPLVDRALRCGSCWSRKFRGLTTA